MEYSLELLRKERDKLNVELTDALNQEPKDWDIIVINERLLQDLNKAIDLICNIN